MKKLISNLLVVMLAISVITTGATGSCFAASKANLSQVKKTKIELQAAHVPTYNLTWSKVKNAKGYQIYVRMKDTLYWEKVATTSKAKYLLKFDEYGDLVIHTNDSYIAQIKIRAYKKSNGKTTYGKFSKILNVDISYATPLYGDMTLSIRGLQDRLKYPSTLQIQSVYYAIEPLTSSEKTNESYVGRYRSILYLEYTAKNDLNLDRRGYLKSTIYKKAGDNGECPVKFEMVNSIDNDVTAHNIDKPFLEKAQEYLD